LVLCFGLLALVIAVPLGAVAAYGTAGGLANYLNVDLRGFRIAPQAVLAQVVTALLIPLLAAAIPVFAGTRISVREAINDYGVRNGHFGRSWIDRAVERVHFLSRPTLLSLRNTFRRKGRLVLTLSTLTLGGAIFIAVFNLWRTCFVMLDEIQGYFMADINVDFSQPYRMDELERLTVGIPEINGIEGWGWNEAEILTDDQVKSDLIGIIAPPSNSMLIQPILKEGRWLAPDDENAIVIGPHLLAKRPDLKVGDDVVIEINRLKTTWHIVGIYKITGNIDPPVVYTNAEILDRYQEEAGMISSLRVITTHNDAETQQRASKALEEAFSQANIQVTQILLGTDWYIQQSSTFNVLIYFLLVMAVLIALVGGLGLTGTMSMNVLERTREIGILRAVGASNGAILRMVITEGVMVGLISWLLALALSLPLTRLLDVGVGSAIFKQTMSFVLGWNGTVYWLGGVIILSTLASALPALRAVRLTVRDVLAYE
jgi:putative ABC transport system permease protein